MKRTYKGHIDEPLNLVTRLTVWGTVTDGGIIRSALVVKGCTAGHFQIEPGGSIDVQGTAAGAYHVAPGATLLIAGRFEGTITHWGGRVLITAGSLITSPARVDRMLTTDGMLTPPPADHAVSAVPLTGRYLEWSQDGRFYSQPDGVGTAPT